MAQKPSIPKGTRDFSPVEMSKRQYIFNTIRNVFVLYGYQQIETPAMETLQTLMGKYGEEGDKLLFKILNSGNYLDKVDDSDLKAANSLKLSSKICEKGLRYDLTVPFARYVVMHRDEIQLPFKRFQMQPVWRADKPQKGRYREFYQCDADVVGSTSLLNEVELLHILDAVFSQLGIRVEINVNNRKLLSGIAEVIDAQDKIVDITVAIDKIDKIGIDNVNEELRSKGLSDEALAKLQPIISFKGTNEQKIALVESLLGDSEIGKLGVQEIKELFGYIENLSFNNSISFDLSLARGLNYYTGTIIEVKALDYQIGSISGGGRYDNLTNVFGMPNLSGVGVSFGADRIYDVMEALDLYPEDALDTTQVLFLNFGPEYLKSVFDLMGQIRAKGVSAELYPDNVKLKKQMGYANSKGIPCVVFVGENEIQNNKVVVKNMKTGEQNEVALSDFSEQVVKMIGLQ